MKRSRPVREAVFALADRFSMLPRGSRVLVGFSGGADSVCLLTLLKEAEEERGIRVFALHVNHLLRGEAADRDERFCEAFCAERGIPFTPVRRDAAAYAAARKLGTEEAAREIRYAAFRETAERLGCTAVATAHHANDNLETILFRLARGTGTAGIRGIPPVRGNIVRPLLGVTKAEILAYCGERSLPFVTDETNADTTYTRNYIRAELVPRMERINPSAAEAAFSFSLSAGEDERYLSSLSAAHSLSEGAAALSALPDPILRRVLTDAALKEGAALSFEDGDRMIALTRSAKAKGSVPIRGRREFRKDRDTLFFSPEKSGDPVPNWSGTLTPGLTRSEDGRAAIYLAPLPLNEEDRNNINALKNIYKFALQADLNFDKIGSVLSVRTRLPGDLYRYGGMTREVKKLFQAKKLTDAVRSSLPVLTDENGIVWIPGFPPRDEGNRMRVTYFCDHAAVFPGTGDKHQGRKAKTDVPVE